VDVSETVDDLNTRPARIKPRVRRGGDFIKKVARVPLAAVQNDPGFDMSD
jgi:hypothetical protein